MLLALGRSFLVLEQIYAKSQSNKMPLWYYYIISDRLFNWQLFFSWLCLISYFSTSLVAQQYNFEKPTSTFTADDGLPNHYFKAIAKDHNGFLWIGTYSGLARFDGSQFKVYQNNDKDPHSISIAAINDIAIDQHHNKIWFATFEGLNKYDPVSDQFYPYMHDKQDSSSILNNFVSAVLVDRQGEIWTLCSSSSLSRYNKNDDSFEHFTPVSKEDNLAKGGKPSGHFFIVRQDLQNDSILWLGKKNSLYTFNKYTSTFQLINNECKGLNSFYLHQNGNIYISLSGGQVKVFNIATKTFISTIPIDPAWRLKSFFHKSDHELWLTSNRGLSTIDIYANKLIEKKANDSKNKVYYDIDFIDDQKRIWAGTIVGMNVYDPYASQFNNYKFEANRESSYFISENIVEDPHTGQLYYNVFSGEGLYIFDRDQENWEIVPPPANYKKGSFFGRGSLWSKKRNTLLILTPEEIYALSPDNKSMEPITSKADLGTTNGWFNFFEDHLGKIWLIGQKTGLLKVDLETGVVDSINHFIPNCSERRYRMKFYQDSQNNVWLSGCDGYAVFSYLKNQFYSFPYNKEENTSNSFFRIRGFLEDKYGNMWVVDDQTELGVASIDHPEKGIKEKYPLKDWIRSDSTKTKKNKGTEITSAMGLAKGKAEDIWILVSEGLIKLNPNTFELELYDEDDGLEIHDEDMKVHTMNFLTSLSDGSLATGFRKGLGIANPDRLMTNMDAPIPYLTAFNVLNEPKQLDQSLFYTRDIYLGYDEDFFSIEFSAINFTNSSEIKYQYKLVGVDKDWTYAGNRNYASYTNIEGGRYIFKVKAANSDGIWSETPFQLTIQVATPWWETAWFKGGIILLIGGLGYLSYQLRINRIRKEERVRAEFNKKLANVEMTALRAQMNPHFIFNCLNSIDYYIVKNETKKASEYLNSFSRLIRLILQNSRANYVNLKDELEALGLYVEMESLRFDEHFDYEINVSNEVDVESIEIPPMLLQPYLENAIWHGLMHKKGKGKVALNLVRENGSLKCSIEDNGIGRERAMQLKSRNSTKRKSMGMKITKDRINMINKLYDSNTHVEVIDLKNKDGEALGTRVDLTIPI